jgi:hypothetical protein
MRNLRIAALTVAALVGSSMLVDSASAMPLNGLPAAAKPIADNIQNVRWVCGPYRCWFAPGPYWGGPYWHRPLYGYWAPRPHWGWHRWGWGWHRRWW